MGLPNRRSWDHRLQVGGDESFHLAELRIFHQLGWTRPASFQIRPGSLQGDVKPHCIAPAETIPHRFRGVVDPDLLLHDAMDFDALPETGTGKEDGPDRRIGHLGLAGLPLHSEPDFMRDLGGQAVKGEGGDEADDAMGGELGHVDEIDFRGEVVHLGKLIETPGGGNQRTVIAEAVQGSPVDPLTKGLAGADDPSLLPNGIDGFFASIDRIFSVVKW